ncbi:MAG: hypothetical protein WHS46_11505 [Desulfosoma sp.]
METLDAIQVLAHLIQDLRADLHALQKAAHEDAEAEDIEGLVSRCQDTFYRVRNLLNFSSVVETFQDESSRNQAYSLFAELQQSHDACLNALATALTRTGEKLAGMQKAQAVSRQYQKIADLG